MKHGSLFSGIGGFDLAAEWMGWENVFHCEWNPFGQKVLKHYWPNAISYEDITKTDFTIHRGAVDILTGGFPCQPYSLAGKRKGKEDERHLWPEMLRAIREIQPSWVVGENVFGLINWSGGLVFNEVQADLEAQGYEVFPYVLPACAVNAPHRRDRVWFVAYSVNNRHWREKSRELGEEIRLQEKDRKEWCRAGVSERTSSINNRLQQSGGVCYEQTITDDSTRFQKKRPEQQATGIKQYREMDRLSGYANGTIKQGEYFSKEGQGKFNRSNSRNGIIGWQDFPTQSPICNGNDGISSRLDSITFPKWRNESIKAGGNAIVPQVVFQIFKSIEQYEAQNPIPRHNP
jgi:DNA (cytosine-5)-methyltransferase 1